MFAKNDVFEGVGVGGGSTGGGGSEESVSSVRCILLSRSTHAPHA